MRGKCWRENEWVQYTRRKKYVSLFPSLNQSNGIDYLSHIVHPVDKIFVLNLKLRLYLMQYNEVSRLTSQEIIHYELQDTELGKEALQRYNKQLEDEMEEFISNLPPSFLEHTQEKGF